MEDLAIFAGIICCLIVGVFVILPIGYIVFGVIQLIYDWLFAPYHQYYGGDEIFPL